MSVDDHRWWKGVMDQQISYMTLIGVYEIHLCVCVCVCACLHASVCVCVCVCMWQNLHCDPHKIFKMCPLILLLPNIDSSFQVHVLCQILNFISLCIVCSLSHADTTTSSMTHCLSVTALLPILERTVFQLALISIPPTALILLMPWATDDMEELTARCNVMYMCFMILHVILEKWLLIP